jgi:hypothetical protein
LVVAGQAVFGSNWVKPLADGFSSTPWHHLCGFLNRSRILPLRDVGALGGDAGFSFLPGYRLAAALGGQPAITGRRRPFAILIAGDGVTEDAAADDAGGRRRALPRPFAELVSG